MTLLFAFFVLLFSMSSPDPVKMSQMQDAMEKASGKPGSLQSLSDIKQELEKIVNELNLETTTNVFSDPRGLILEMDGDICFLSGSVSILKDMEKVLEKASKSILNRDGDYRMIVIEGHTDSDPIPKKLQDKYPALIINGDIDNRIAGNLNISFPSLGGKSLIKRLTKIAVSSGSACTSASPEPSHVLKAIGLSTSLIHSTIRIGIGKFNTRDELDIAAEHILEVITNIKN